MQIVAVNFGIIRATSAVAEFLVRVELNGPTAACEVTGRAVGPHCPGVSTVEVAYPMSVAETSDTSVSLRCVIPEPNLWTPERPFTYEVTVEVRTKGELVDSRSRVVMLRAR